MVIIFIYWFKFIYFFANILKIIELKFLNQNEELFGVCTLFVPFLNCNDIIQLIIN